MADNDNKYRKIDDLHAFVTIKGVGYHIQTVFIPNTTPYILTNAFINDTIADMLKSSLPPDRDLPVHVIQKMMRQQRESMIQKLRLKHTVTSISKSDYMRKIRRHISKGNLRDALKLNEDAVTVYPNNPYFMTYLGYLRAAVLKEHEEGISICKTARDMYQSQIDGGELNNLSYFYVNIGRTYFLSGKRDFAITSYRRGLKFDPGNEEALAELDKVGARKSPPVPFLNRDHPVNKYVGLFLSKFRLR
jgi:tetratricopeptide (TPR) repeat protein